MAPGGLLPARGSVLTEGFCGALCSPALLPSLQPSAPRWRAASCPNYGSFRTKPAGGSRLQSSLANAKPWPSRRLGGRVTQLWIAAEGTWRALVGKAIVMRTLSSPVLRAAPGVRARGLGLGGLSPGAAPGTLTHACAGARSGMALGALQLQSPLQSRQGTALPATVERGRLSPCPAQSSRGAAGLSPSCACPRLRPAWHSAPQERWLPAVLLRRQSNPGGAGKRRVMGSAGSAQIHPPRSSSSRSSPPLLPLTQAEGSSLRVESQARSVEATLKNLCQRSPSRGMKRERPAAELSCAYSGGRRWRFSRMQRASAAFPNSAAACLVPSCSVR